MRNFLQLMLSIALLFVLVSCSGNSDAIYPRNETLYVGGMQWGSPNTFNPLDWWSAFPVMSGGNNNIMYEQVLKFNPATAEMEPLLCELYEKNLDYISLLVNPKATWSDGKPLTAEDIVYNYELSKSYDGVPTSYVWEYLSEIKVDTLADSINGDRERITFVLTGAKRVSPIAVLSILQAVRIVPKHTVSARLKELDGDFGAFQSEKLDSAPVISGPYQLHNYTNERIVLKRRDDYWGNDGLYGGDKPKPKYIIHPILKNNSHFTLALQKGNIDISATFIPRIQTKFNHGVKTWYAKEPFYVASSIPALVFNVTKYPLSDKAIRRAIGFSINYDDIKELAVCGYSEDMRPGIILPFGAEKRFFSEDDVKKYGAVYDKEIAQKILSDAGYKAIWKDNGVLSHMENSKGEKVPSIEIMSPSGWTDWEAVVRLVIRDLRSVGIDAREHFVDGSLYWTAQPMGHFDVIMHTPAAEITPASPLSRFEAVMSARDFAPVGQRMNENYGRYNDPESESYNPVVDSIINAIPLITEEEELIVAYRLLNRIFMEDQPAIPLVYRPTEFYQFSTKTWGNFPTENNAFRPPQMPTVGVGRDILWKITTTGKGT